MHVLYFICYLLFFDNVALRMIQTVLEYIVWRLTRINKRVTQKQNKTLYNFQHNIFGIFFE